MKLSEAVREIIRLGNISRAYWDSELPKHHPDYPLVRAGEDSGPPPPEDQKIKAILDSLAEEQIYALIAVMYVGRGDFSANDLPHAYLDMKEAFPRKDLAVAQMTGKGTLAEYLEDAVQEIKTHHIDLDDFKFPSAVSVS